MIVRLGGPQDVDAAVDVYVRGGFARRGTPPAERIEHVRSMLLSDDAWFFAAVENEIYVGMAAAKQSRERFGEGPVVPGLCYLDLLYVIPERWGEGIGGILLDTVIADARGRGFSRIHLMTNDNNERAHALYTSRDFLRSGVTHPGDAGQPAISEWVRRLDR